jgi:hypothetical protein
LPGTCDDAKEGFIGSISGLVTAVYCEQVQRFSFSIRSLLIWCQCVDRRGEGQETRPIRLRHALRVGSDEKKNMPSARDLVWIPPSLRPTLSELNVVEKGLERAGYQDSRGCCPGISQSWHVGERWSTSWEASLITGRPPWVIFVLSLHEKTWTL